jgi:serine/threonine protein kinase
VATATGQVLGTVSYMAPEQAVGHSRDIGPWSDVYGLGALLYAVLTGRPPFQGPSFLDTLDQVRSAEPVPPGRLQPRVPRDLEAICLRCLEKELRRRYPSAQELAKGKLALQACGETKNYRPGSDRPADQGELTSSTRY